MPSYEIFHVYLVVEDDGSLSLWFWAEGYWYREDEYGVGNAGECFRLLVMGVTEGRFPRQTVNLHIHQLGSTPSTPTKLFRRLDRFICYPF